MKKVAFIIVFIISLTSAKSQVTGSFVVTGTGASNINTYYPVTFVDGGFGQNVATELTLGRSGVHQDASWRGAIISKFRYHVTNWGNGGQFIDANIHQNQGGVTITNFIGGWADVTAGNGDTKIVIWLRGGGTTYFYNANYAVTPVVYDGVANALPYNITNGGTLTYKTTPDAYVTPNGNSVSGDLGIAGKVISSGVDLILGLNDGRADVNGNNPALMRALSHTNWRTPEKNELIVNVGDFAGGAIVQGKGLFIDGTMGVGTLTPSQKLEVNGNILSDGNVYIGGGNGITAGANTAGYALAVNGPAIFTKAVVKLYTSWPDYVFDKGFKLRPIDSLSAYIQQNKHLPDIPAASEVQKQGLDVGDNQTKLLQKIEELTLYVINENKKNNELNNTVEEQGRLLRQLQAKLNHLEKR